MAAQQSGGLLGCFVLVRYPEPREDGTQCGHPVSRACPGRELLEDRAARRGWPEPVAGVLQASLEGIEKGVGWWTSMRFERTCEHSQQLFLGFCAQARLLGCHVLQGQRDVETLKKFSICGLSERSVCTPMYVARGPVLENSPCNLLFCI